MEITVLIATNSDADDFSILERECFSTPWTKDNILESMDNSTVFFKAVVNNKTVGYCGMQLTLSEGYITNVAVTSEYRGCGVASELLKSLFEYAKLKKLNLISLEVRVSNLPAISLYKKLGFLPLGERKNFYKSPRENALIMTKFFKD